MLQKYPQLCAKLWIFFLFQSFFQGSAVEGRQMNPVETVFAGQDKGLGQIIAGYNLAFLFCCLQKFPGALGSGGIVHIKNTDDGGISYRHIIADGKVQSRSSFVIEN